MPGLLDSPKKILDKSGAEATVESAATSPQPTDAGLPTANALGQLANIAGVFKDHGPKKE